MVLIRTLNRKASATIFLFSKNSFYQYNMFTFENYAPGFELTTS